MGEVNGRSNTAVGDSICFFRQKILSPHLEFWACVHHPINIKFLYYTIVLLYEWPSVLFDRIISAFLQLTLFFIFWETMSIWVMPSNSKVHILEEGWLGTKIKRQTDKQTDRQTDSKFYSWHQHKETKAWMDVERTWRKRIKMERDFLTWVD